MMDLSVLERVSKGKISVDHIEDMGENGWYRVWLEHELPWKDPATWLAKHDNNFLEGGVRIDRYGKREGVGFYLVVKVMV